MSSTDKLDKEILFKLERFSAYQERCIQDIKEKLKELEVSQEAFQPYVDYLLEENFINEQRFTESYVRGHFKRKKWGRNKIREGLRIKKIDALLIENALESEINDIDYLKTIQELAEKYPKAKTIKNTFEKNAKIFNYLQQKGFEAEVIWRVMKK